jgi:putative membrane protein
VTDHNERRAARPDASSKLALERTVLAHERTMLSWVRTATSLITFGFGIQQFFRITRAGASADKGLVGPHLVGSTMIVIGLLALLLATLEHRFAVHALSERYPRAEGYPDIPRSRARVLAALIALIGLLALLSMLFRD